MSTSTARVADRPPSLTGTTSSKMRWVVCGLLFLATTINYMDRNVFGLIEPMLHSVPFMGWNGAADKFHQPSSTTTSATC